jgi:hypothetical protein
VFATAFPTCQHKLFEREGAQTGMLRMPFSSVVVTSGCARAHAASPKADSDVENRILPIALLSHSRNSQNRNPNGRTESRSGEPKIKGKGGEAGWWPRSAFREIY